MAALSNLSLEQLQSKFSLLRGIRPVSEFAGSENFTKPRSLQEATHRIEQNLHSFFVNYAIVCLFVLSYAILTKPLLLLSLVCLGFVWLHASRTDELEISGYSLKGRNKTVALSIATVVILFLVAGTTIFVVIGICSTVILAHAMFHKTVTGIEGDDIEMQSKPSAPPS
eukprot:TRINITY_DN447_c0_g1_i3.p1 TRINITY_DN447_c0_g1~~TRINITY_DN447_c0_g1_i3.p1  ORF type:complete len:169 (+),score=48.43 TRINITY_DN447_c0_g1_i3:94-600(+)